MAAFTIDNNRRLTFHAGTPWRIAAGLGLTIAIAVPALYDALSSFREGEFEFSPWIPVLIALGITAVANRWSIITFRKSERRVRWMQWQWMRLSYGGVAYDQIESLTAVSKPSWWDYESAPRLLYLKLASGQRIVSPIRPTSESGQDAYSRLREQYPAFRGRDAHGLTDVRRSCEAMQELVDDGKSSASALNRSKQISLRRIFVLTGVVAVAFFIRRVADAHDAVVVMLACVAGATTVLATSFDAARRMAVVITSLYAPFVWTVWYNRPLGSISGLLDMIPLGPTVLPMAVVRLIRQSHSEDVGQWMLVIGTAVFITAVLYCSRRSWRATLWFSLLAALTSAIGSFGIFAGTRI